MKESLKEFSTVFFAHPIAHNYV